ncbi:uncharacterized protein LOC123038072 [Drosophila rhopaloa]|uniref:Secreted protein n=1 Tax=Drosophila rhopaloa TaxID=1041015 RepID=A0ABM5JF75_DRORH|nr:uncharacterized protein LOC123038072 [Drosophila rhopaloa]
MRPSLPFWSCMGIILIFASITCAESSGKSRNREDRFDLENESVESRQSDEPIASCGSSENVEDNSCRQSENKHPKRKTFRFAI